MRFLLAPPSILLGCAAGTIVVFIGCLGPGQSTDLPTPLVPMPTPAPTGVDRTIRVRLTGSVGVDSLTVAMKNSYLIEDVRNGRILEDSSHAAPRQKVTPAEAPATGIRLGGTLLPTDRIRIVPTYDATLVVNDKAYRGTLLIQRSGTTLAATNELDVESYLRGVLVGELPTSFHPEAFAALAVAARTYVLYQKLTYGRDRDYDVMPDERSQMYLGVVGEKPIAINAVERTRGQVCALPPAMGGAMFCTYYSSCCGGISQSVAYVKPADPFVTPLAGGVVCPYCRSARVFLWPNEVRLSKAELTRRLVARYPSLQSLGPIQRVEPDVLTSEGRLARIKLVGAAGRPQSLCAEDFRLAAGGRVIRSTWCKLHDDGDGIVFYDGRGFGHGMGLCQYGADGMGRAGKNYRDILTHYYPGCVIRTLDSAPVAAAAAPPSARRAADIPQVP